MWIKFTVLLSWAFLLLFSMHVNTIEYVLNKHQAGKHGAYSSLAARLAALS